jgi:hypothetical protein
MLLKGIVLVPRFTVVPDVAPVYGINVTVAVLPLKFVLVILAPTAMVC